MRNPLYNRIKSIAVKDTVDGQIRQSAFDDIRNRGSVRAVLIDLGYKPNSEIYPTRWRQIGDEREDDETAWMPTKAGSDVLKTLLTHGIIYTAETALKPKYLQNIIQVIRSLGYEVKIVRESRTTVAYRLITQ